MKDYQLIVFDWDGTVMDSVDRIVSSMRSAAIDVEITIPTEQAVKDIIGLSLLEASIILFPDAGKSQLERLAERYKKHYIELDDTPTPLFSHAIELFEGLLAQNKTLAVATGKGREGLDRLLNVTNTSHYFASSRCASECQSKPHPEMLTQLMEQLEVPANKTLMIGDTIHDMAMAQNAGVDRVGVTFGVHNHAQLSAYQPKAIVDDLTSLADLLI